MMHRGYVDGLSEGVVHGWAYDADRPGERVEVVVRADGQEVARGTADRHRADLEELGIGDGRHGFRIPAPAGVRRSRLSVHFGDSAELVPDNVSIARRMQLPLAENPLVEDLIAEDGLSGEQAGLVRAFARDGFLKFRIADPAFEALADAAVQGVDWSNSDGVRVQDAWANVEAVRRLAALPEVLELLELLYGRPAIPFQTLNFQVGTQQATHSDSIHFSSRPSRFMCGVWIALEPVDQGNGALHYYPGSHRLPIFDLNDLGLLGTEQGFTQNYAIYCDMLQAMVRAHGLRKQVALMDRGEAIVWAANLYHGGDPILDPTRTRHSQVTHYYFEGCAYYAPMTSDPYLDRYDRPDRNDIRTGEPIGHWFGSQRVDAPAPGQTVPRETVPRETVPGQAVQPASRSWLGRLLGG